MTGSRVEVDWSIARSTLFSATPSHPKERSIPAPTNTLHPSITDTFSCHSLLFCTISFHIQSRLVFVMLNSTPWHSTGGLTGGSTTVRPTRAHHTTTATETFMLTQHQQHRASSTHTAAAAIAATPSSRPSISSVHHPDPMTSTTTAPITDASTNRPAILSSKNDVLPSSSFSSNSRRTLRSTILSVADSLGLSVRPDFEIQPTIPARQQHSVSHSTTTATSAPVTPFQLPYQLRPNLNQVMSPQFETTPSQSSCDHALWLAHGAHLRERLVELNRCQQRFWELDQLISAHDRELDVHDVLASQSIDTLAEATWAWAQHLAALMSHDNAIPVTARQPEPTEWKRNKMNMQQMSAASSSAPSHHTFTPAPVYVNPNIRSILQPPANEFLYVDPALQPSLRTGIERMCLDVSQWKGTASSINKSSDKTNSSHPQTTPPEALAWTSTLEAQQKPLVSRMRVACIELSRVEGRVGSDALRCLFVCTSRWFVAFVCLVIRSRSFRMFWRIGLAFNASLMASTMLTRSRATCINVSALPRRESNSCVRKRDS